MALIMLSGMFGFGGMVSSISFIGDGGRGCWCGYPLTAEGATFQRNTGFKKLFKLFLFHLLLPAAKEMSLVYYSDSRNHFLARWDFRGLPVFGLTWLVQNTSIFKHQTWHIDFRELNFFPAVYFWVRWHSGEFLLCSHEFVKRAIWSSSLWDSGVVQKLREGKSLSGVLFLITQRASALYISSAASPQVIPVLSLYCFLLLPN